MPKSHDEYETLGLTKTQLFFSSRSVRNTTVSLAPASGGSPTPVYIIETPVQRWKSRNTPNTIYKIGKDEQKEELATLGWKRGEDWIVIHGERKMLRDVLPQKGFLRRYTMPTPTGLWTWKTLHERPKLFNASGELIARYSKNFKAKEGPPATMTLSQEAIAELDMIIIGLVCCRQKIRRSR